MLRSDCAQVAAIALRAPARPGIPERRTAPNTGAGFLLYSWGEDLKDDGGRPVPDPPRTYPPDGDIVWTFEK